MRYILLSLVGIFFSCANNTAEIKNKKEGDLTSTFELHLLDTKKIYLDDDTAPKIRCSQMFVDSSGVRQLTFLNIYNNSIYFYNYESTQFIKKIEFNKKGKHEVLKPKGYYIKNLDSIYIYDNKTIEVLITNKMSEVINRISLRGKEDSKFWFEKYPQYNLETVKPFIETSGELLLTGVFYNLPHALINKKKFMARINLTTNHVKFDHTYPIDIYGNDYNWTGGLYTDVYSQIHPTMNKIIYSFPASHDLYVTDLFSDDCEKVYAGSNFSNKIKSINKEIEKTSMNDISQHIIENDSYAAILYDKYREVYYRFFRKAIPYSSIHTKWEEKPVSIIIMDKDFQYLGETTLGKWSEWHWENSFVTEEGLNIEYLDRDDIDESALNLKVFIPKKTN